MKELIEQIGRERLEDIGGSGFCAAGAGTTEVQLMARALLAVLDAKAELWEIANPGEGSRYSVHERKPGDWDYGLVMRSFYGVPTAAHLGTQIFQLRDGRQWYDVDRDIYDENISFQEGRIVYSDVPPAANVNLQVTDEMALAFHQSISDGSIGSDDVSDIKAGLTAAFANATLPPAASEPVSNDYTLPPGWKLVPIEPTEGMVISGFESKPREGFSDPDDWGAFEAMSGCQQAAHKARLCYAAMLAAAPVPGGDDA